MALVERCSSTPRRQNRGQRRWHHRDAVAAVAVAAVAARAAPGSVHSSTDWHYESGKAGVNDNCVRTNSRTYAGRGGCRGKANTQSGAKRGVPSDRAKCRNDVLVAGRGRRRFLPLRALRSAGSEQQRWWWW